METYAGGHRLDPDQLEDVVDLYGHASRSYFTPERLEREIYFGIFVGSTLYVAGGRKLSLTTNSARLDVYDLETDRWSRGPDMPTARGGLAAAALGARLVVVGGEQPSGTFGQVETYDEPTAKWIGGPSLPTPRHGLGAASLGDRVYVVGGGPTPGLSVSPANEFLRAA